MKTVAKLLFPIVASGALSLACGASKPTQELTDARRVYDQARNSNARQLVPDELLSAKQALDRAEQAFEDDPGSFKEKSMAYLAQRRAQLAMSRANIAAAQREMAALDSQYKTVQDKLRSKAEADADKTRRNLEETKRQLEKVRSELKDTGGELTEKQKALQAQEKELARKQAELEKEKKAREDAEKRAAAAMASLAEIAKVKEEQRGMVITLDGSVLFVTGKADLLPIAQNKLDTVAQVLQDQDDSKKIVVEGHTDSVGSDQNNMRLSQQRADSVRSYLVSKGVPSNRISAVGRGESMPIGDNKTADGRANNRRVEIIVK